MITVKDWMSKPVITATKDISIFEACKMMDEKDIGALIISVDGKKAQGIITERDMLRKVIAEGKDPKSTKVEDIMTKKVTSVTSSATLLEVSKIMTKNVFRRVLVEDDGVIVGIVTSKDLLELMSG